MINDDDDNDECETRAAVWIEARNVEWLSRPALLAPVARSWQGGRRSG